MTTVRGHTFHACIAHTIRVAVRDGRRPPDQWVTAWFDARNPRAWVPIETALEVLKPTPVPNRFRKWLHDMHAEDITDADRERANARFLLRLLTGAYAWVPALAALLEQVPQEALAVWARAEHTDEQPVLPPTLASTEDAEGSPRPWEPVELAFVRERLLLRWAALDELIVAAIEDKAEDPGDGRSVQCRVVQAARATVGLPPDPSPPQTAAAATAILSRGAVAELIPALGDVSKEAELKDIFRPILAAAGGSAPPWTKCWLL